jgi:hypothetical protein
MQELAPRTQPDLPPVAIENPPVLAPTITAPEQSVLYGAIRERMTNTASTAGAVGGAVGGAIIGGIWSFVTKGGEGKNHWGRKTFGTAAVLSVLGALVSRMTWGNTMAEKTVSQLSEQMSTLPPEQQAMAYQQLAQQLGTSAPASTLAPQTTIHADTVQHQALQPEAAPQIQ